MFKKYKLETGDKDVVQITDKVREAVAESGVSEGICVIHCPHTTAALTITSFWDPNGFLDLQEEICRLVPTRIDFKHQFDTPTDAAGHVKSSLIGVNFTLPIHEGKLMLGGSQGLFFVEFDGPRHREFWVKTMAD